MSGEGAPEAWFEDLAGSGAAPGPVSAFGLAAGVLAGLGVLLALALRPAAALDETETPSPEAVLARKLEEAVAPKLAGRYAEAWTRLRGLHDESPWEPAVNLELALLHEDLAGSGADSLSAVDAGEARLELAAEYVELALRKRPEWRAAQEAAARIALARGRVAVRAAGLADRTPVQTLAWVERASSRLAAARSALPAAGPDLPVGRRDRLLAEISREEFLARVKQARGFAMRRGEGDSAAARTLIRELVEGPGAPDDVKKAAAQLQAALDTPPTFGPGPAP